MANIIVGAVVVVIVALVSRHMWKARKSGSCSCGGDCGHCKGCH